jgi:hypothetical protein
MIPSGIHLEVRRQNITPPNFGVPKLLRPFATEYLRFNYRIVLIGKLHHRMSVPQPPVAKTVR